MMKKEKKSNFLGRFSSFFLLTFLLSLSLGIGCYAEEMNQGETNPGTEGSSFISADATPYLLSEEARPSAGVVDPEETAWPGNGYAEYTGLLKNENDGKTYYIVKGQVNTGANGLICVDGDWYYFENGVVKEDESNLIQYNGGWYYVHNGKIDWTYSTLAQVNGKGAWYCVQNGKLNRNYTGLAENEHGWFYVSKGLVDFSYSGLVNHYGGWYYIQKGYLNWNYSNLVQYNGGWYYVHKGKIDWSYTTLARVNDKGSWYYVEKGVLNWKYSGLAYYNNNWFYIEKGVLNWNYSNLVQYNGGWYYVEKGVLNRKFTGLTKYNGGWYYIDKGVLNWKYTGLVSHYGSWYYVEKGVLNWKYTGLVYHYGNWYYVEKGVLNWKYSSLTYYNGGWYYVEKGKINWSYSNLVQYNGNWYYVKNGKIDWSYSGKAQVNNTWWYYVIKGNVQMGRFKLSDGKWYQINHSTGELYESKAVIAIDAGHQAIINTGTEPLGPGSSVMKRKVSTGTAGYVTGQTEYSVNLAIALKLQSILEADGYTVVMTRTSNDVDISNAERAQIANNANAAAFVRIHADGSENHSVSGATMLCQTSSNPYNGSMASESYSLSNYILNSLSDATGCRKVGISQVDNMTGINWSKVPVSIVEVGFLSNATEDQLLATDDYRYKVARGIANGIEAYVNSKN